MVRRDVRREVLLGRTPLLGAGPADFDRNFGSVATDLVDVARTASEVKIAESVIPARRNKQTA